MGSSHHSISELRLSATLEDGTLLIIPTTSSGIGPSVGEGHVLFLMDRMNILLEKLNRSG